jgi:alpha-tubulin suppressor-like RCC1 family protein
MPVTTTGVQYSGIWNLSSQASAKALGTWTGLPQLFSWGGNGFGQLGLGNTTQYSSPKQVGALLDWSNISESIYEGVVATKTDGTLWSWGRNVYGQLGDGTTIDKSSPVQVGTLTTWSKVAGGAGQFYAIKNDNTLWSWGHNNHGQLGLGNVTSYSSPKQVGALTTWSSISGGLTFGMALKTNGTLWAIGGWNINGELGLGNTTEYNSPKQVGALTTWAYVAAAGAARAVAAIKTDGTLWTWGNGLDGKLGLGNLTYYSSPKQVGILTDWLTITCGYAHAVAAKTDGTLWSWGINVSGQLGLGNTVSKSSPNQIGALTTWLKVTARYQQSFSIKTDGTLWAWGLNNAGQLGLGNLVDKSSPNQVGALTTWTFVSKGETGTVAIKTT